MSRQLPVRRKSRLDKQISQDSPPAIPPGRTSGARDLGSKGTYGVSASSTSQVATPSYPFPIMSQRLQMSSMSPTGIGPQDRTIPSGTNTPASIAFYPPGTNPSTPFENAEYPSPNLYELALLLHSEPGVEGFWNIVVRIMREFYMAERVSLTIPTDLTDLENSPWGQKATYNEAEEDSLSLTYMDEADPSHAESAGPAPEAQGHGTIRNDKSTMLSAPSGPTRMHSDESLDTIIIETDANTPFSPVIVDVTEHLSSKDGGWASQPTEESQGQRHEEHHQPPGILPEYDIDPFPESEEGRPHGHVFLNLQPLNYEAEPLIDGAGVMRVLERGKTVVLSREYRDMQTKWERLAAFREEKTKTKESKGDNIEGSTNHPLPSTPGIGPGESMASAVGTAKPRGRKRFPFSAVEDFSAKSKDALRTKSPPRGPMFEEFEQSVSSPWSQSPAPSPAIRADPADNPFFAPAKVDEESFNPSIESPHYSVSDPIHAIGLENASTVIHIPLVHPSTSIIGFPRGKQSTGNSTLLDISEKRTPIAILSILSSVIPFPSNLAHSLTHLSPLMATAFALSQAHSNAALQFSYLQYQGQEDHPAIHKDSQAAISSMGSVTSPSDYTKSSSTTNSLAGTPNQDINSLYTTGGSSNEVAMRSPLGSPAIKAGAPGDSYFFSKQRRPPNKRRSSSGVYQIPMSPGEIPVGGKLATSSRVGDLIEEAAGWPAHPAVHRTISELMDPEGVDKREITERSEVEPRSDSEHDDSIDMPSSEDMQTPKAVMSPRTEAHRQIGGFFGSSKDPVSTELRIQIDSPSPGRNLTPKPGYIALPTPGIMPASPVLATPSRVPLPETPLHGPSTIPPENYAQASMARRSLAPTHIKLNPQSSTVPFLQQERGAVSTPLVVPSATQDLQAVESILEASSYSLPSPTAGLTEELATTLENQKSSKRVPLRRHSSMASSYRHTRLHSRGAEYGASFPTLANSSNLPLSSGYERMKSSHTKSASTGYEQPRGMPPPSNKLLRTIIDAIPVHVFTAAPQTGETTWVNSRMLSYRGATSEEFMADPYEPFHPDDRANYIRLWLAAVRKGEPFSYQIRIRRFDGCYRWFMIRAVPLRDNRGIIVHWFGTNMDIHDQRSAEVNAARQAEMAESEAKYRSLANSSPQIVFAATVSSGITFANNQWLDYSGQTLDQALHLGFMEYVHPIDRQKCALPGFRMDKNSMVAGEKTQGSWFTPLNDGTASGNAEGKRVSFKSDKEDKDFQPPFSTELRLRRKDGEYRWHLVRCVSVEADNVEGLWFGTCTDINDHKLLEQRLKDANDAAKKAMESKTRFLSNMSHEIRTPLIGISGMVNFLLDTPLNGEQLDYCHTISSSSDGLLMVINDILDLSKVEAGMMRLSFEWFRVRSLVEDANELLSTMAISKELELNYLVEDDVPSMVSGDRIRLRQVILNIVGVSTSY